MERFDPASTVAAPPRTTFCSTIPCGNTYLGCVMVAERIARKMKAGKRG